MTREHDAAVGSVALAPNGRRVNFIERSEIVRESEAVSCARAQRPPVRWCSSLPPLNAG